MKIKKEQYLKLKWVFSFRIRGLPNFKGPFELPLVVGRVWSFDRRHGISVHQLRKIHACRYQI